MIGKIDFQCVDVYKRQYTEGWSMWVTGANKEQVTILARQIWMVRKATILLMTTKAVCPHNFKNVKTFIIKHTRNKKD